MLIDFGRRSFFWFWRDSHLWLYYHLSLDHLCCSPNSGVRRRLPSREAYVSRQRNVRMLDYNWSIWERSFGDADGAHLNALANRAFPVFANPQSCIILVPRESLSWRYTPMLHNSIWTRTTVWLWLRLYDWRITSNCLMVVSVRLKI